LWDVRCSSLNNLVVIIGFVTTAATTNDNIQETKTNNNYPFSAAHLAGDFGQRFALMACNSLGSVSWKWFVTGSPPLLLLAALPTTSSSGNFKLISS
jgi:hypothetical protein